MHTFEPFEYTLDIQTRPQTGVRDILVLFFSPRPLPDPLPTRSWKKKIPLCWGSHVDTHGKDRQLGSCTSNNHIPPILRPPGREIVFWVLDYLDLLTESFFAYAVTSPAISPWYPHFDCYCDSRRSRVAVIGQANGQPWPEIILKDPSYRSGAPRVSRRSAAWPERA